MPGVETTRVKTTGRGELDYSDQLETTNSVAASSADEAPADLPVLSVAGTNLGSGEGLFAGSNGQDNIVLEFKSLVSGPGIVLTHTNETITITATGNSSSGNGGSYIGDSFDVPLGNIAIKGDGSWAPGAVPLNDTTSIGEAIDRINEFVGLIAPPAPPAFPNASLTITGLSGNSPLLAAGVPWSGAGTPPAAGASVSRIVTSTFNSNVFNDVGPAQSGTVQALINGITTGQRALTNGDDSGTYGPLTLSDEKDFPANQPGIYKSIDIALVNAGADVGLNTAQIKHTGAGDTAVVFFVRDDLTSAPSITAGSVVEQTPGTVVYSSGVPHYNSGAILNVSASYTNIAGQTYYGGSDPLTISGTNGVVTNQSFNYTSLGVTTPIARNTTTATTTTAVQVAIDGTTHSAGTIQGVAKNVNGASGATNLSSKIVLVKRGTASSTRVDEMAVPVTGLGSAPNANFAIRMGQAAGDTPAAAPTSWVNSTAIQSHDAAVVGGVLLHSQIDYSNNYLPAGPNYSQGRSAAQYVTFSFNRASVSNFKINVTGTYAGVWIKMPGVSDNSTISPNALNGWWDATKSYNGAGVPGHSADPTAGCAVTPMAGASGSYTITFGPQSSTNATSNQILVRIRLNAGQTITALSFSN